MGCQLSGKDNSETSHESEETNQNIFSYSAPTNSESSAGHEFLYHHSESTNPFEFHESNLDRTFNQSDNFKGMIIGSSIQAGTELLGGIVKSICYSVNKSKDIEIEKLNLEKEKMIQKEKEKKELMENLKLKLHKIENDFYEIQIIKFQYDENLIDKNELVGFFKEYCLKNNYDQIINKSHFFSQIDDEILDLIKESRLNLKKSDSLNIYIMGITGVGKTCLKNAICKNIYSMEKFGERGTNMRKTFKCECHNYLSFTDNIGFELGGLYSIQNLVLDTQIYIMEKIKSNTEAIHCIWYCITGTRLQEEEYKVICDLRKIYKENNIPLIIVYTQAIEHEKIKDMKKFINEKLKIENNEEIGEEPENVQFIPLLSKETKITFGNNEIPIKPYNVS